jgi:hypothetical protein
LAKEIIEYDPFTGMTTSLEYNHADDAVTVYREQDVSPILEMNKAMQNDAEVWKDGVKNSWAHYAQIPNIVIEKWKNDHGVDVFNKDHQKAVFKLLNDPQYRYLKTTTKFHAG